MSWIGGKKALREEIVRRFPLGYERYIEVFGGAAWVLFFKEPGKDFEVYNDFNHQLAKVCGQCDGCGEGAEKVGDGCPLMAAGDAGFELPDGLLREAGIPENAKLCAYANEEANTVIITAAGYGHDLRDIPQDTLEMFHAANVCLGELEEHLIAEDTVYGG